METNSKDDQISRAILKLIAEGKSLREAVDTVLGAGTFERLATELYEECRKKALGL